jgi:hypothetical protein
MKAKASYIFHALILFAVLAVIVTSFVIIGSPSQERAKRMDDQRANDLQTISSGIDQYYNLKGHRVLPQTLENLRAEPGIYVSSIVDPRTNQEYSYQILSTSTYELCADFETNTTATASPRGLPQPYVPVSDEPSTWLHGASHACFDFHVHVANSQ